MTALLPAGMLLVQAALVAAPAPSPAPWTLRQDSVQLARLRARMQDQREVRVRVGRDFVELTRPRLVDSTIAYHDAWFDRLEARDTLPNPLPLGQVSVVQVRGKGVSLPAVVFGGLSIGVSVLASSLLTKAIDSRNAPDGGTIVRVSLLGFGIGAVLGGAQSAFSTRWVTAYRR
jgi:hypothetical protein